MSKKDELTLIDMRGKNKSAAPPLPGDYVVRLLDAKRQTIAESLPHDEEWCSRFAPVYAWIYDHKGAYLVAKINKEQEGAAS